MKARRILIVLMFLTMAASIAFGQTTSESGTGIEGVITISPIHGGPTRVGIPNSGPMAKTAFNVSSEKEVVASFTTDEQGRFRVALAPGHYTVSFAGKGGRIGRRGPFEVDVVAGKMTKVEWKCDSGMR